MIREDELANEDLGGYRVTGGPISNGLSSTFLGEGISLETSYQNVVIELLYAARTQSTGEQENILQKIASLQYLRHPHVLPILSTGIYRDIPYIVTEYLPQGSLYNRFQRRLNGQSMPTQDAFFILAQAGHALHYAHQQHIIHGSFTAQDVLFRTPDEALITGFHRHALLLPDETDETNFPERSVYLAPEQLMHEVSEKSDQYALGCLAYALFTGYQAFMVPSIHMPGTYYKTKSLISPGRLNPALSLPIEEAILKAMARDPGQRYQSIDAFLAALGIPPAIGDSDLKETVAMLAQIMKGEFLDLPVTPAPQRIEIFDTVKMPLHSDVIATRERNPTRADTFSQVPLDVIGQAGATTLSDTMLPDAATIAVANQHPSIVQHAHGGSNNPPLRTVKKSFTPKSRRVFAVMIALILIILVCVILLVNLNLATTSKGVVTTPSSDTTSMPNFPAQTNSVPTRGSTKHTPPVTSTLPIPSRNATPVQGTIHNPKPTSVPTAAPKATATTASTQVLVALTSFFNNTGIGAAPGQANFDGFGYSYPANQLPAAGQINIQGIPYQFSGNGPGANDNIIAFGQTLPFTPGNYQHAFLLASSSWGPLSGTVTIQYTNGSTSTTNITVPDWYNNTGVLNTTFRYSSNGINNHPVSIVAIPITLDPTRVANALILPRQVSGPYRNGRMHIFALTVLP